MNNLLLYIQCIKTKRIKTLKQSFGDIEHFTKFMIKSNNNALRIMTLFRGGKYSIKDKKTK